MNKIKLICFDLDKTIIVDNSWRELGLALGISYDEDKRLYDEYKNGKITYDQWNDAVLKYYSIHIDSNREGIKKILSKYTYNRGVKEIIQYLKSKGYVLALVSGSIDILVKIIADELGFDFSKANNQFIFDDHGKLTGIQSNGDDTIGKATYLNDFCKISNIDIKECACVGDGENDIELFKITGHGITFRGSKIEGDAWKVIDSLDDLRNIF